MSAYGLAQGPMIAAFVFGMIMCYLVHRYKSLIAPIIVHVMNNSIVLTVKTLGLPLIYPLVMTGIIALMLYAITVKKFSLRGIRIPGGFRA